MIKDKIIQFVCFVTKIGSDQFITEWEPYAKKLQHKKQEPNLLELGSDVKNRYRYISQHEWADGDFKFSFMNKSKSEHFPENEVQVVQVGGYILMLPSKKHTEEEDDVKLMAFISHNEYDLDFYRELPMLRHILVYQAYYESCIYGYILELHTGEAHADELLQLLEKRNGVTAAIYKDCSVTA